jgi:hypothetical protein
MLPNKYALYEASVQSPDVSIEWYVKIFKELRGIYPKFLREDFCGTFALSCEWVKRNRNNRAIGLDLDPEPLEYGKTHHLAKLKPEQRSRMKVFKKNVLERTSPGADVIMAGNFSFFCFQERKTLMKYLRTCVASLKPKQGILVLEMAGGPGMIQKMKEQRTIKRKSSPVTYIWDQRSFNPITRNAHYSIHFKFNKGPHRGKIMKHAFTYDWRVWTIPEVRDAMAEAGFSRSVVFWEASHKGNNTGEYLQTEDGDNAFSWIAYVVGLR